MHALMTFGCSIFVVWNAQISKTTICKHEMSFTFNVKINSIKNINFKYSNVAFKKKWDFGSLLNTIRICLYSFGLAFFCIEWINRNCSRESAYACTEYEIYIPWGSASTKTSIGIANTFHNFLSSIRVFMSGNPLPWKTIFTKWRYVMYYMIKFSEWDLVKVLMFCEDVFNTKILVYQYKERYCLYMYFLLIYFSSVNFRIPAIKSIPWRKIMLLSYKRLIRCFILYWYTKYYFLTTKCKKIKKGITVMIMQGWNFLQTSVSSSFWNVASFSTTKMKFAFVAMSVIS